MAGAPVSLSGPHVANDLVCERVLDTKLSPQHTPQSLYPLNSATEHKPTELVESVSRTTSSAVVESKSIYTMVPEPDDEVVDSKSIYTMVLKPEETLSSPALPQARVVQPAASSEEYPHWHWLETEARLSVLPQVPGQLSLDEQLPRSICKSSPLAAAMPPRVPGQAGANPGANNQHPASTSTLPATVDTSVLQVHAIPEAGPSINLGGILESVLLNGCQFR